MICLVFFFFFFLRSDSWVINYLLRYLDKETKNNKRVKTLSCQFLTLPLATARKQTDPVFFIIIYFWLCCYYYLFLAVLDVGVHGLSLVAESGIYSLAAVCGLLIAVAPLVSEQKL